MPKKRSYLESSAALPALLIDASIHTSQRASNSIRRGKVPRMAHRFWSKLGPGLVTEASGQDPSGIATFSQTGAQYGFQFLWMQIWLYPLDSNITAMCARIGLATGKGLAANIRHHFSRRVLYICALLMFSANAINIGADLGAMAKAFQLLVPQISFGFLVVAFAVISIFFQLYTPYAKFAKYLKWLALALLSYVLSAMLAHLDWNQILHQAIIPHFQFNKQYFIIACAVLGTTISPYLFFWQTSQTVEERFREGKRTLLQRVKIRKPQVRWATIDVWTGALLAETVAFFIIAACGGVLNSHGITNITSAAQAAEALRPFAGDATFLLFAIGIIGAGLLAVPVLAGSSSYIVSEALGWKEGLYHKVGGAASFYGVIVVSVLIGLAMNFLGIDVIKALIYAAVVNGIVSPIIMVLILKISGNKEVMGRWAHSKMSGFFGWFTAAAMGVAGVAAIYAIIS